MGKDFAQAGTLNFITGILQFPDIVM